MKLKTMTERTLNITEDPFNKGHMTIPGDHACEDIPVEPHRLYRDLSVLGISEHLRDTDKGSRRAVVYHWQRSVWD